MGIESNVWEKAWQCGSTVPVAAGAQGCLHTPQGTRTQKTHVLTRTENY